jgi:hypothetical protein
LLTPIYNKPQMNMCKTEDIDNIGRLRLS